MAFAEEHKTTPANESNSHLRLINQKSKGNETEIRSFAHIDETERTRKKKRQRKHRKAIKVQKEEKKLT